MITSPRANPRHCSEGPRGAKKSCGFIWDFFGSRRRRGGEGRGARRERLIRGWLDSLPSLWEYCMKERSEVHEHQRVSDTNYYSGTETRAKEWSTLSVVSGDPENLNSKTTPQMGSVWREGGREGGWGIRKGEGREGTLSNHDTTDYVRRGQPCTAGVAQSKESMCSHMWFGAHPHCLGC